jgi:hypothetical protein
MWMRLFEDLCGRDVVIEILDMTMRRRRVFSASGMSLCLDGILERY